MPIIRKRTAPVERKSAIEEPLGGFTANLISDAGGLTQFGAFTETLDPGAKSSFKHWHTSEDEMIYVLAGTVIAHEGTTASRLFPGDAACFPAGGPLGHFLENDSPEPATYLVIGTRAAKDIVTYPDHDRRLHFDRASQTRRYETLDGAPADKPKI